MITITTTRKGFKNKYYGEIEIKFSGGLVFIEVHGERNLLDDNNELHIVGTDVFDCYDNEDIESIIGSD